MARSSADDEAQDQEGGGHSITGSGAVVAAAAAAATGAATYAVRRARANRNGEEPDEETEDQGGLAAKKDDLVETLSAKASDLKQAAGKLRPNRHGSTFSSVASGAWEAAWEHLRPAAGHAAASLGQRMAEKAPEVARKELIPRFIEGFQRGS